MLCCAGELLEVIHLIWPLLKERAQQHMKGLVPSPGYTETLSDRLDAIIRSQRSKCCHLGLALLVSVHIHTHILSHMHARTHTHMHTHTHTHMHTHTQS